MALQGFVRAAGDVIIIASSFPVLFVDSLHLFASAQGSHLNGVGELLCLANGKPFSLAGLRRLQWFMPPNTIYLHITRWETM